MADRKFLTGKNIFRYISIGLYLSALTQDCYCTAANCVNSAWMAFIGALGVFFGGACLTWLANPLLFYSWLLVIRGPKASLWSSVASTIISISFLFFSVIIANEAGGYQEIISYKAGYWLWVSSSAVMMIGNLYNSFFIKRSHNL